MISVSPSPTNTRSSVSKFATQAWNVISWPFTNRYASPIWLFVRLYLASVWFQFGIAKLQSGWLIKDPLAIMFKPVANGVLAIPIPFLRGMFETMISSGVTPYLSHTMPFLELAVGLSMLTGVLLVPASLGAILLVSNILLAGMGTLYFDGRIILLHVLIILAYRVAGLIGIERLLVRTLRASQVRLANRSNRPVVHA